MASRFRVVKTSSGYELYTPRGAWVATYRRKKDAETDARLGYKGAGYKESHYRRSRRRQEPGIMHNPSTGAWLAIGLGALALGIGAYFLTKSTSSSSSGPQLPPNKPPAPPGDKYVVVSIPGQAGQGIILLSQACAAARALAANGNAADAAAWAQVCRDNGGTV